MSAFLFALSAVMPIILMIALGYCLRRAGILNESFTKVANKLVFRTLLPAMLFLNIYRIESFGDMELDYIFYVSFAVLGIFLLNLPLVLFLSRDNTRRGPMLQASFRSNYALIGIPLATSLYGEAGGIVASLLSAAVVPVFNALAVITLSIFRKDGEKPSVKKVLLSMVKNPLILSIFAGLVALGIRALFVYLGITFRLADLTPVYKVLEYLSGAATPIALLVLGAQFEFSRISGYKKELTYAVLARCVLTPLLGIGVALLFFRERFGGAEFAAFIAAFATPVAVSSVPMTQEMDGDTALAGQIVIFTTLTSALTTFLATFILRSIGVF